MSKSVRTSGFWKPLVHKNMSNFWNNIFHKFSIPKSNFGRQENEKYCIVLAIFSSPKKGNFLSTWKAGDCILEHLKSKGFQGPKVGPGPQPYYGFASLAFTYFICSRCGRVNFGVDEWLFWTTRPQYKCLKILSERPEHYVMVMGSLTWWMVPDSIARFIIPSLLTQCLTFDGRIELILWRRLHLCCVSHR